MTTLISFIIVLGILVFVHELGHFLVAKALGVGVDRFSIGFPPKMFGFQKGETEYCVSWVPLGGYVKLRGEDPMEEADPEDPKTYSARPPGQKAAIIAAGPIMNLVLAFLVMPLVFMVGMSLPAFFEEPVVVGWVVPDSAAEAAGIMPGDQITALDGREIGSWERLLESAALSPKGSVDVVVLRGADSLSLAVSGDDLAQRDGLGVMPPMEPVVGALAPGFPAEKAGLRKGDHILSVGGLPVGHWNEMAQVIHASPEKAITLVVRRDGETLSFEVTPRLDERTDNGLIGISPVSETVTRRYGFTESITRGFNRNLELLRLTFRFVWDLVTFNASIKMVGGPIMIFQVTGEAAKAGLSEFLAFMAFLSLQLGILNLFPIPVLDGGHLVFLGIEGIKGGPIEPRYRDLAQRVGFFLLLLLILVISYNDILRMFTGK